MEKVLADHLVQATKHIEEKVDAEIERLDKLDDDELELLRERRMQNLKKQATQKQDWLSKGHGEYSEISNEKELFDICKQSERVVCHFYRDSTFRCKIIDKHLSILAQSHPETRFLKIDVARAPFLVKRLNIRVMPTVALMKDGKTGDYIVGFDDLGGVDDFSTEVLEWRLGRSAIIEYAGDLLQPPDQNRKQKSSFHFQKKTIREKDDSDSDDDN